MKDLLAKKVPVKSIQAVTHWKQGKGWCVRETDTIESLEGIMAEFSHIHTDIIPVKPLPQVKKIKGYVVENYHFTTAWDCDKRTLSLVKLD